MQEPYPVPGVITLKSATKAVFRADIDGSLLNLTRVTDIPGPVELCGQVEAFASLPGDTLAK